MNMNIKKLFMVAALAVMALATTACDQVPVGNVGIKVYKLGGSKGVDQETLTPGRYYIGWNEELFLFPTFAQNRVWTKETSAESPGDESITFQTTEGMSVNGDFGIQYTLDDDKITHLFQKYRRGVNEITTVFLRNEVRNAINEISSTLTVDSIYGPGKSEFMKAINDRVKSRVTADGINVDTIYLIGEFRLPAAVVERLNAKLAATQMAEQRRNEVAQAKAEADKKIEEARGVAESTKLQAQANAENIAIQAEAQAKANRTLAASVTDELIRYQTVEKWNGAGPTMVGSGGPVVTVQAPTIK